MNSNGYFCTAFLNVLSELETADPCSDPKYLENIGESPLSPIRIIEFVILCIVLIPNSFRKKVSLNSNGSFDFIITQFGLQTQNPNIQENVNKLSVNIFLSTFCDEKIVGKIVVFVGRAGPYGEIIGHYFGHFWTMSEISRIPGQIL